MRKLVILAAALVALAATSSAYAAIHLQQLKKAARNQLFGAVTFTKDTPLADGRKRLRITYPNGDILRLAATDAEWKAMVRAAKASTKGSGTRLAALRDLMRVRPGRSWRRVTFRRYGRFADGRGRLVLASRKSGKDILRIGAVPADWDKVLTTLGIGTQLPPPAPPAPGPITPPALPATDVPYDSKSAFNTPAPASGPGSFSDPVPQSSTWINTLAAGGAWSNDPDQYSRPIYRGDLMASSARSLRSLAYSFKFYGGGDQSPFTSTCTSCSLSVPDDAVPSNGSDGHVVLWDKAHGIEYGFWQFYRNADGSIGFSNGYKTSTGAGSLGQFKDGSAGEGAGIPYLAGTVTKEDVQTGVISHALAAAVTSPGSAFVYPASKSDGGGGSESPPEGTRLLLDPSWDENQLSNPIARMMARALKTYGVYIVDGGGSNKFYMEDRTTAGWPADFTRSATSGIPWDRMRAVAAPPKP
jgi:hypothetical protein